MTRSTRTSATYDVVFYQPLVAPVYVRDSDLPSGGAEIQIHLIARELARVGARVAVVSNPHPGLPERFEGVDVIPKPGRRRGRLAPIHRAIALMGLLLSVPTASFVKRVAGFDAATVAIAAKARGRRFVYSSANVIDFDYEDHDTALNAFLFTLGVRLADEIVVQTAEQAVLCENRFGRRASVIRSISEPAERSAAEPEFFLWVGRVVDYKRPLEYVELARAFPDAQFHMVTVLPTDYDVKLYSEIRRAAAELSNLRLLPPCARDQLGTLIDSAVAVVNTADTEGLSNVALEAWARGIPALALSHDPDSLIEHHALGGFARGSFEELLELAKEMWVSRHDRESLSDRCRDYVLREHSAEYVARQWAEALGLDRAVVHRARQNERAAAELSRNSR